MIEVRAFSLGPGVPGPRGLCDFTGSNGSAGIPFMLLRPL